HLFPALAASTSNPLTPLTLVGRVFSALFDSGTILVSGYLTLLLVRDATPGQARGWNVALLVAGLETFTPLQLQLSHLYACDTLLLFFCWLRLLACVALVEAERPLLWSFVAGLSYGLALATKFSAAPLAVPLGMALLLRWFWKRDLLGQILSLLEI